MTWLHADGIIRTSPGIGSEAATHLAQKPSNSAKAAARLGTVLDADKRS